MRGIGFVMRGEWEIVMIDEDKMKLERNILRGDENVIEMERIGKEVFKNGVDNIEIENIKEGEKIGKMRRNGNGLMKERKDNIRIEGKNMMNKERKRKKEGKEEMVDGKRGGLIREKGKNGGMKGGIMKLEWSKKMKKNKIIEIRRIEKRKIKRRIDGKWKKLMRRKIGKGEIKGKKRGERWNGDEDGFRIGNYLIIKNVEKKKEKKKGIGKIKEKN